MSLPFDHAERMARAHRSLDGLSVGDAFGEHFFRVPNVELLIAERALPFPRWRYTDDTEMALAIVDVLDRHGAIDADDLAACFARRYQANPSRGYGSTAHQILQAIGAGDSWQAAAGRAFDGYGSMGNGAAMRVAPLGAYFADDLAMVVQQATASAVVTHAHAEGVAGAVAIALAAAKAWRIGMGMDAADGASLIEAALRALPVGETQRGVQHALQLPLEGSPITAARLLGSGLRVTAPDTVPFTLWCAARHLVDFEDAMWTTVSGLGDRDTTCAIVGGLVALSAGTDSVPAEWLRSREPLAFNQ